MSKKIKRVRPTSSVPTPSAPPPKPHLRSSSAARRTSPEEFAEEYAYVGQDLRRVFMLAAIMFILLIVLNLVIR